MASARSRPIASFAHAPDVPVLSRPLWRRLSTLGLVVLQLLRQTRLTPQGPSSARS